MASLMKQALPKQQKAVNIDISQKHMRSQASAD